MWIVIILATGGVEPPCSCTSASCKETQVSGTAARAETACFVVVSNARQQDARAIARACECWRTSLRTHWCPESDGPQTAWDPKCQIVIHPGSQPYLAVVGAGGAQTFASSWIEFARDKQVSKRRIDLRGDGSLGVAALPHEMTHVVLADLLGGQQPPRWADEGMALLADAPHKQQLHERDLREGLQRGLAFSSAELVLLDSYPQPARVPAFYGQSASLTAFLVARDKPTKFVEFLRQAQKEGYDAALQATYDIQNIRELERLWQAHRQRLPGNLIDALAVLAKAQPLKRRIEPALVD